MSIKKHEEKYWHIRKPYKRDVVVWILSIMIIVCIMGAIITLGFLIDGFFDVKKCETGMLATTKEETQCFANEDYFKYNFGHNIDCSCFYFEDKQFKVLDYTIE